MLIETKAKVLGKRFFNENYYSLILYSSEFENILLLGQFIEIEIPGEKCILRRPISIARKHSVGFELMIKIIGKGTKYLSNLNVGDMVTILGPLGNSFPIVKK